MAKKPPEIRVPKVRQAAHENVPAKKLQEALEISDAALMQQKLDEIVKLLWVHEDASEEIAQQRKMLRKRSEAIQAILESEGTS